MFLFRMKSMSRQRSARMRGEELVSEIQVLQLLAKYVEQELQIFAIGKSWSYRINDLIHRWRLKCPYIELRIHPNYCQPYFVTTYYANSLRNGTTPFNVESYLPYSQIYTRYWKTRNTSFTELNYSNGTAEHFFTAWFAPILYLFPYFQIRFSSFWIHALLNWKYERKTGTCASICFSFV